jgi:hypothetical protein
VSEAGSGLVRLVAADSFFVGCAEWQVLHTMRADAAPSHMA